jgi:hypothetical protein
MLSMECLEFVTDLSFGPAPDLLTDAPLAVGGVT